MSIMQVDSSDDWLEGCLSRLGQTRVGVLGDFCIDAYWMIDSDESEASVETGLPLRRVRSQRYSLGGAGNVVANLVALGVGEVCAVGLVGKDAFGELMLELLSERHVAVGRMLQRQDWQTMVYAKPHIDTKEQNRIDFGAFNAPSADAVEALAGELDSVAGACSAVILNQQVPGGVSTPEMIERINGIIAAHPECTFLVDSRHRAELYRDSMLKLNVHEVARLCGKPHLSEQDVPTTAVREFAAGLFGRTGKPVFVTRGDNGIVVADSEGLCEVPGIEVPDPKDPVGAGDTVAAALAAVVGSGGDCRSAAAVANLAASVVVRKVRTTGTASPDEIRHAARQGHRGAGPPLLVPQA